MAAVTRWAVSRQALADAIEANLRPHGELVEVTPLALAEGILEHLAAAGEGASEAAEPPLPEGQFGRIELPGYRQHTGFVTEESRFGVQVATVRDWDGQVIAEVMPGPGSQFVHLPAPLKRPASDRPSLRSIEPPALFGDDEADLTEDGGPW